MSLTNSFAVDAVVYSEDFKHSKFVAYRVKDAIADYFREKYGKRPNVSVANPDLTFHIHISHDHCSLSLDSSGESLHKRGYRQEAMEAPLNEILAAGMILLSGWDGQSDFIDPMCGSGTIPIEAALIAHNMAPGLFRSQYAFEKWKDFDKEMFESVYNDDSAERPFNFKIKGYDKDPKAIAVARRNARAAGLADEIDFTVRDFKDFEPIQERTVVITNPPYGERLNVDNLLELYSMIGERLKHALQGGEAWIISYKYECFDKIGLKPSAKIPLFNGALPCEVRKYEIFAGKYDKFRQEGEHLDKSNLPTRRSSTLRQKARLEEKKQLQEGNETVQEDTKPTRTFKRNSDRGSRPARPFKKDTERGSRPAKPFRKEGTKDGKPARPFKKDGAKKEGKPFSKGGSKGAFGNNKGKAPFKKEYKNKDNRR
jgi:putative N6-adenine-specific DNA methylase